MWAGDYVRAHEVPASSGRGGSGCGGCSDGGDVATHHAGDQAAADEIAAGSPVFEERLPADKQPPGIPGANRNGRKTLIADYTDPQLSNLAGHPRLIAAVAQLTGPYFLINSTSAPVITYKSPPGHERFDEGYHVDWPNNPPLPGDDRFVNGVVHFTTVEPGGGAFMVRPGSHRLVADSLADPALRQRMLDQDFNDFPGFIKL